MPRINSDWLIEFFKPLKIIVKPVVMMVLFMLKPFWRVFGFIIEWTAKLAPFVLVGGYAVALWQIDSAFLAQAAQIRNLQDSIRTHISDHSLLDIKYYSIMTQESTAKANIDRGNLIKEQVFYTAKSIASEAGKMLSHPITYRYGEVGAKLNKIYTHVQYMPAKAIGQLNDGDWDTEIDFSGDWKDLDSPDKMVAETKNYPKIPAKRNLQAEILSGAATEKPSPNDLAAIDLDRMERRNKKCHAQADRIIQEKAEKHRQDNPNLYAGGWTINWEPNRNEEYLKCVNAANKQPVPDYSKEEAARKAEAYRKKKELKKQCETAWYENQQKVEPVSGDFPKRMRELNALEKEREECAERVDADSQPESPPARNKKGTAPVKSEEEEAPISQPPTDEERKRQQEKELKEMNKRNREEFG